MEKESISALEYIHLGSIGDLLKCQSESDIIYGWLENKYKINMIEGCKVYVIRNAQTIEEKIMLIQYKKITNDIFPFLYVAIQPTTIDAIPEIETKMHASGYVKAEPLENWEQAGDLYN